MKQDWKVEKEEKKWTLFTRPVQDEEEIWTWEWARVGTYKTRRSAVTIAMLMRDRGERITWPGGAIRMGIAMVDPC